MKEKAKILIANDDGFQAKGLKKLTDLMRQIGEVMVISTEQPMSAKSHSMTIREPLRVNLLEKILIMSNMSAMVVRLTA